MCHYKLKKCANSLVCNTLNSLILLGKIAEKYQQSVSEGKRLRVYTLHNQKKAVTAFL